MKKIIFCLGTILVSLTANAQQSSKSDLFLGVRAGLNVANVNGKTASPAESRLGMHAGAVLTSAISWKHSVQGGLFYSQKGFAGTSPAIKATYHLNYLDIPVVYRYNLTPKRRALFKSKAYSRTLYLVAGPQVSTLLGATNRTTITTGTGESAKTSSRETNIASVIKAFEFSMVGGLDYNITNALLLNARFAYGLTDVSPAKTKMPSVTNTNIQLGLSYMFAVN